MTSTATLDSAAVLAGIRRDRIAADEAEARVLAGVAEFALVHQVDDLYASATWGDSPVPLAGPGAPMVSEFAVIEIAAALGRSRESGRHLVAHALELKFRLPQLWDRIQTGSLQAWRARRIAEETICLSVDAAEYVDRQVAKFAHRVSQAETQRLVDAAIAEFMPEFAQKRRDAAADGRHFTIDHQQVSFNGTSYLHGELDLRDALDLEDAIRASAAQLADLGSEESLDARRAAAVGMIARGEQTLGFQTDDSPPSSTPVRQTRDLTVYVHLDDSGLARVEGQGLLTVDQIKTWCGSATVIIKPVIDLNTSISTSAYQVPDRIREHVVLRDRSCVFAYCTCTARRADLDHIEPYEPDGALDQTNTDNLAALCRSHHRAKTLGGWTYTTIAPGIFLWRSPHGYQYLRDRHGTEDVTPRSVGPPGS